MEFSQVENDMSRCSLQHTECTTRIRTLKKQLEELEAEIRSKNDLITRAEQEVSKRNAIIERKQTSIDQYNKKLEQLLSLGGVRYTNCRLASKIRYNPYVKLVYFIEYSC